MSILEKMKDKDNYEYLTFGDIFSIGKCGDGRFWIEENCDHYYKTKLNKDKTINLFTEILNFIKE